MSPDRKPLFGVFISMCDVPILFVDTLCGYSLWLLIVATLWGYSLRILSVATHCGYTACVYSVWLLRVSTPCGYFALRLRWIRSAATHYSITVRLKLATSFSRCTLGHCSVMASFCIILDVTISQRNKSELHKRQLNIHGSAK